MSRAAKTRKHQRRVLLSVVLPAVVELIVGTDDDDPSEDSDWEILSVISTSCEATPRMVEENAQGEDLAALAARAARAKDQQ